MKEIVIKLLSGVFFIVHLFFVPILIQAIKLDNITSYLLGMAFCLINLYLYFYAMGELK